MSMNKTLILGIVHGTAQDGTGGKLAAIFPSFYIWDLLEVVKAHTSGFVQELFLCLQESSFCLVERSLFQS
jgi:hypothetical protein